MNTSQKLRQTVDGAFTALGYGATITLAAMLPAIIASSAHGAGAGGVWTTLLYVTLWASAWIIAHAKNKALGEPGTQPSPWASLREGSMVYVAVLILFLAFIAVHLDVVAAWGSISWITAAWVAASLIASIVLNRRARASHA